MDETSVVTGLRAKTVGNWLLTKEHGSGTDWRKTKGRRRRGGNGTGSGVGLADKRAKKYRAGFTLPCIGYSIIIHVSTYALIL